MKKYGEFVIYFLVYIINIKDIPTAIAFISMYSLGLFSGFDEEVSEYTKGFHDGAEITVKNIKKILIENYTP